MNAGSPLSDGFQSRPNGLSTWPRPPDELMARMLMLVVHTAAEAIPVGTGFLISEDGKFVTAEHVASELRCYVDEVQAEPVEVKALLPSAGGGGGVLVRRLWTSPDDPPSSDITVGILALPPKAPPLSAYEVASEPLAVGETVMALGFASMTRKMDVDEESAFTPGVELKGVVAAVVALHATGYTNVHGPVFEMAAPMDPGMSGGPILRAATGEVVGVCSYGSKAAGGQPYCFGSVLRPEGLEQVRWEEPL